MCPCLLECLWLEVRSDLECWKLLQDPRENKTEEPLQRVDEPTVSYSHHRAEVSRGTDVHPAAAGSSVAKAEGHSSGLVSLKENVRL